MRYGRLADLDCGQVLEELKKRSESLNALSLFVVQRRFVIKMEFKHFFIDKQMVRT